MRSLVVVALIAGSAHADQRYTVRPGETLEYVARAHGCSTDAVLRANRRDNTLVPAGTVVTIPACSHGRPVPAQPSYDNAHYEDDPDARAHAALAVIDGTARTPRTAPPTSSGAAGSFGADADAQSIGLPWDGKLQHAHALPKSPAYVLRRPAHAFGTDLEIAGITDAIAAVRARFPEAPVLAIGDLSAEHGGRLSEHLSHQSGRDADIGFYFTHRQADYPAEFVGANADFDVVKNFALLTALLPHAQMIFLDTAVQARLYKYAAANGMDAGELARIFQYPRGADAQVGIVRHWPHHGDHFHVRFPDR